MCKAISIAVLGTFCLLFSFGGSALGLECLVGTGDASNADAGETMNFKVFKCGERGSQLATVDNLVKNVTDTIANSWNTLTSSISKLAGGDERAKRQVEYDEEVEDEDDKEDDDENYACVKVVLGKTAYRSCIPKYGEIRINCTTAIGHNVLCYCHEDQCNSAHFAQYSALLLIIMLLLHF